MGKTPIQAVLVLGAILAAASGAASAAIDDKTAQSLMAKAACNACHAVDKKGVGPSYQDVAKKRKAEKDAVATLAKKVREGGSGGYGPVPMPPNAKDKISDDEVKQLVEWVLSK